MPLVMSFAGSFLMLVGFIIGASSGNNHDWESMAVGFCGIGFLLLFLGIGFGERGS